MATWTKLFVIVLAFAGVAVFRAVAIQSQGILFEQGSLVPVGPGSGQVVLVDVNRDGHLDMVTRHLVQRSIGVFIGDGKGGFSGSAINRIALAYQPGGIAIEDVNGDRAVDLIVA